MKIEQFFDEGLAHSSYALLSENQVLLVDPARNPEIYYNFAKSNNAKIVAVIETHPHADFVSSHLEISKSTGATIYVSSLLGANYPHKSFDEGNELLIGKAKVVSMHTPGHSPDSISVLVFDEDGNEHSVFTGDTLFVGDVGRPDLREEVGNIQAKKEDLARQMYDSTRNKLMKLQLTDLVYPSHGPGSLCGKNLCPELFSTIGHELINNPSLQTMGKDEFVTMLIADQPFVPKYFGYDVDINKKGAPNFRQSVDAVNRQNETIAIASGSLVIDTRPAAQFKKGYLKGSINIPNGEKFETWVGSVVSPNEKIVMICENPQEREILIEKLAKIGYEALIESAILKAGNMTEIINDLDLNLFKSNPNNYFILDVRNTGEVIERKIFPNSINIPLPELRERINEINTDKPIVIHCKGGYRSAVGTSIATNELKGMKVFDLSEAILEY